MFAPIARPSASLSINDGHRETPTRHHASRAAASAAFDGELRFGNGFTTAEHPDILRLFSTLGIPLAHYTAAGTQLQLSVQNRDRPGQLTALGAGLSAGHTLPRPAPRRT